MNDALEWCVGKNVKEGRHGLFQDKSRPRGNEENNKMFD
jgi:hypothetical protein